jgi:hypothetical protein
MRTKSKTALDLLKHNIANPAPTPPWEVIRAFGDSKNFSVVGDQICLGEDYLTLEQARYAIEWFATQLGGQIKWED